MIKSVYNRIRDGLKKTRESFNDRIGTVLANFRKVDDEFFEELEEILIQGDIGVETTQKILEELEFEVKKNNIQDTTEIIKLLKSSLNHILGDITYSEQEFLEKCSKGQPHVIVMVGVNGSGKTTSIGKLANFFKENGKKVTLAASDTFRAAAVEQLEIWAKRSGAVFISHPQDNADPAAVAFDAYQSAKSKQSDILLIDTAGRLHTKSNLMEELKKIIKVLKKQDENLPHEIWIVIDGSSGQNAIAQTETFMKYVPVSGLIITKLDGTAHGGVIVAISEKFRIPIYLMGVGESINDLQLFNSKYFVDALFES